MVCEGRLGSLNQLGDTLRMGLIAGHHDVFFPIDPSKYPQVALLTGNERIRVTGKLQGITVAVELADVVIEFEPFAAAV